MGSAIHAPVPLPNYQQYGQPTRRRPVAYVRVTAAADLIATAGNVHHPHRHPDLYQLAYITGGRGEHIIEEQAVALHAGGLYLLRPGVAHGCTSSGLTGFIIHFSPDFLLLPPPVRYRVQVVPPTDRDFVAQLCDQLLRSEPKSDFTRAALELLLLRINEYPITAEGGHLVTTDRTVHGFLELAQRHYARHRDLAWYAAELCVSTNHLSTCVRAKTGRSCSAHLREQVLNEARHRLRHTADDVSTIARDLHFRDPAYFWRYFKKYTGRTPGAYRAEVQK